MLSLQRFGCVLRFGTDERWRRERRDYCLAKPRTVPGSELTIPADLVIVAYGFDLVPFPTGSDLSRVAVNDWGINKADEQ